VVLVLVALVLLAAFIVAVPYVPSALRQGSDIFSNLASTLPGGPTGTVTGTSSMTTTSNPQCEAAAADHQPSAPDISGSSASVAYPSDYCAIAAYVLTVINQDRATNSAAPVTLDYNSAAQQHADSMLYYGYFSHFDTQGYKPYMRYSLLGGLGADFENVAYIAYTGTHFTTTDSVDQAISALEHSMMYNDSSCCNNGHRYNILNPLHNKVSLGVAYDGTTVYFDEEFENAYINLDFSVSNATSSNPHYVSMTGTPIQSTPDPSSIFVFYDSLPAAETASALNNGPREYNPGTFTGGVLPNQLGLPGTCNQFSGAITVCADTWTFNSNQMAIKFSLNPFLNKYGPGVYTIYLVTGSSTDSALTTISVFLT
jgi:uncharacterized protein YkwD